MKSLVSFRRRLRSLGQRRAVKQEIDEELRFHLEQRTAENIAAGMSPKEAAHEARKRFGNLQSVREECRDVRGASFGEATLQDIHFGLRMLRKNPGFTCVTILTLALGIGAVIAIFTAADDLLFRPLPFRDPERLVRLWESNAARPESIHSQVSADNLLDWKARNSEFEDIAAYYEGRSVFHDGDRSEELHVQGVTANFFSMLGVTAVKGRLFTTADESETADTDPQLVISYRLWRTWFGGDPNIVGRTVRLDSLSGIIIGITPPSFCFGDRKTDLWLSMELKPAIPKGQGRDLNAIGRLKRNVRLAQAQSQMTVIARLLELEDPRFNKNWTVTIEPLRDAFARNVKTSLLVLLCAVGLLLAVACANVANLLLARCFSRRSEMAIRVALGAGRWRLTRQLLTESLLIATCSGIVGVVVGQFVLNGIVRLAPRALTQTAEVSIDLRVVLFAVGLTVVTGILFGLAPAIISAKSDVASELKLSPRTGSMRGGSFRAWLIAGEIAVSVILLTSGSLLFRSLVKLQSVDPGLNAGNVLTFHFRVPSPENVNLFALSIERIANLPGVRSASATSFLPFDGPSASTRININGRPTPAPGEEGIATVRTVMPRYFETIGIPIRSGRDFTAADNTPEAPMRFIVNETFVRKHFASEEALGKSISTSMARTAPFGEIIGVVGDVKEGSLKQESVPTVYYVYAHMPYGQMSLVARTERDPMTVLPAARKIIHDLDSSLPVADARRMETILGETYARELFCATLMGAFSIISLLLAAIGIYGIMAYSVSERTREIGIRLAVGAPAWRILMMVLSDAGRFVVPGLVAGLAGAFGVSQFLSSLLFETGSKDPLSFLIAPTILLIVALVAAYFPARRAARMDPMIALRIE